MIKLETTQQGKKYRFFYHYRKQTKGMTVHFRGRCIPCKNVICDLPSETKWNKSQPQLVMQGFCHDVMLTTDGTAHIF